MRLIEGASGGGASTQAEDIANPDTPSFQLEHERRRRALDGGGNAGGGLVAIAQGIVELAVESHAGEIFLRRHGVAGCIDD